MRTALGEHWAFIRLLEIGIAVSVAIKVGLELPSLNGLYSTYGFAQAQIADVYTAAIAPSLNLLSGRLIFGIDARVLGAFALLLLLTVSAGLVLLGLTRPWAAGVCWFSQVVLFNSTQLTAYGADGILLTLTFYSFIMAFLWKIKTTRNRSVAKLCQATLLAHLSIVYLASGWAKLKGVHWLDGSAFWYAIHQPQFHTPFTELMKTLCRVSPLSPFVSWSTLFFEISYPFLLFWFVLRRFALGMALVFHLGIGLFLGLWFFSAGMCCFALAANYPVLPARLREVLASARVIYPSEATNPESA